MTSHGYQSLPWLVAGTRRVATVPTRLAALLSTFVPVRQMRPNFAILPLVDVLQ